MSDALTCVATKFGASQCAEEIVVLSHIEVSPLYMCACVRACVRAQKGLQVIQRAQFTEIASAVATLMNEAVSEHETSRVRVISLQLCVSACGMMSIHVVCRWMWCVRWGFCMISWIYLSGFFCVR